MPAAEILRIAATVGSVQLVCNLIANQLVFKQETYQRALNNLSRTKAKLEKEKQSASAKSDTAATAAAASKRGGKLADKNAKRLKRAEDDHADAVGSVARIHVAPNILTSIVFVVLLRVLGTELKGTVVGVLPFAPFKFMRRITARGLQFEDDAAQQFADMYPSTDDNPNPMVSDIAQACSFMFVYFLSTMSVKFYCKCRSGESNLGIPPLTICYLLQQDIKLEISIQHDNHLNKVIATLSPSNLH